MGEHVVLHVDGLVKQEHGESRPDASALPSAVVRVGDKGEEAQLVAEEAEPLIQMAECRICQDEEQIRNLETPCACNGSLKYAHRTCVQRWCNEKGDTRCEICHESYKPGYTAPPRAHPDETTIDISEGWTITGTPLDLRDPRILAVAGQHYLFDAEYDEYHATNSSGAAFCRSAALILIALLLLRHALAITNDDGDEEDASTLFSLFLLRAAGFLLPCYIMAWAISILQRRSQRQEVVALTAGEVALILESGQHRGLHFTIAPDSPTTPQQEALQ
ncbi:uncharacterized protein [Typha angustifolia]|uniref:uncharacterized protein isoform X1 n=1 Tax=Typha angustifolia TaxID=59011 RepID=UPI003C2CF076